MTRCNNVSKIIWLFLDAITYVLTETYLLLETFLRVCYFVLSNLMHCIKFQFKTLIRTSLAILLVPEM